MCKLVDVVPVVICEVIETTYVNNSARSGPFDYLLDVLGVRVTPISRKDVTKESRFHMKELTFLDVEDQIRFRQGCENLLDVVDMFLQGTAKDKDIIHVDDNEDVDVLFEESVDMLLKTSWAI
jgi:hypothetical protein